MIPEKNPNQQDQTQEIPSKINHTILFVTVDSILIVVSLYLVFIQKLIGSFQQLTAGVLIAVGCGRIVNSLAGKFEIKATLTVTGSVALVCFIMGLFYKTNDAYLKQDVSPSAEIYKTYRFFSNDSIIICLYDTNQKNQSAIII